MKILALEFSSAQMSAAVVEAAANPLDLREAESIESGARSSRALAMVDQVLKQANLEREEIELLAIGIGPGSYSGVRTAIALAQGWQLAREVRVVGISSAECLAAEAQRQGIRGRVNVVIDAQRNEFYLAGYEIQEDGYREITPLRLATQTEAQAVAQAEAGMIGPEALKWFPASQIVFPRATTLGRLAAGRHDYINAEKLEPIYLREISFVKAPPPRTWPTALP